MARMTRMERRNGVVEWWSDGDREFLIFDFGFWIATRGTRIARMGTKGRGELTTDDTDGTDGTDEGGGLRGEGGME